MLSIKLSRKGKRNQPFFRVVLLENHKDPWGDFLEDLGFLNPLTKKISLKKERIKYWLSQGAQPSGTVHNLLINQGIIKDKKIKVTKLSSKVGEKKEEKKESVTLEKEQNPAMDKRQESAASSLEEKK